MKATTIVERLVKLIAENGDCEVEFILEHKNKDKWFRKIKDIRLIKNEENKIIYITTDF